MQLLSLLTEIGNALTKQSVSTRGQTWNISRMVNYQHGLGRMTMTPFAGAAESQVQGTIFLQTYNLADESLCLKANLSWQGSDQFSTITVYSKPGLEWRKAIAKIASAWLAGPSAPCVTVAFGDQHAADEGAGLKRLVAVGG